MSIVRLYLDTPLSAEVDVEVGRDQAHYLFNVMRLGPGDRLSIFNGCQGEWDTEVIENGKRRGVLRPIRQQRAQIEPPDTELLFAPIKKSRTDFIVEKACELGCRRIQPVFTQHTNSERLNTDRLRAHMVEAAEQCGGLSVPILSEPAKLSAVLSNWSDRMLIFCDESRTSQGLFNAMRDLPHGTPISILIGPEGGFSPNEIEHLHRHPAVLPVSLGPRILRADTAAVAALSVVQAGLGYWQ